MLKLESANYVYQKSLLLTIEQRTYKAMVESVELF